VLDNDGARRRIAIPLEVRKRKHLKDPGIYTRRTDVLPRELKLMTWDFEGLRLSSKAQYMEDVIIMESKHYSHWMKLMKQSKSLE